MNDDKIKDIKNILDSIARQVAILAMSALEKNNGDEIDDTDFVKVLNTLDRIEKDIDYEF